jgi:hypothetical protein
MFGKTKWLPNKIQAKRKPEYQNIIERTLETHFTM